MRATLKALSALLSYPTEELQAAMPELRAAIDGEGLLPVRQRDRLERIMADLETGDLYDAQERYVLLFDRTRSLSLHMFEHIHGESRDRGQAMVDLKRLYQSHGLELGTSELPDYLPLFLEFLSLLPPEEARGLLAEPLHIFEAIRLRLKARKVCYSSVFSALEALARETPSAEAVASLLEEPDDDPDDLAALDKVWAEAPVTFGPGAAAQIGCATPATAQPVGPAIPRGRHGSGQPAVARKPASAHATRPVTRPGAASA